MAATSKAQIGSWYERTVLRRLWGLPAHHFTRQRFWQALGRVGAVASAAIESDLVRAVVTDATLASARLGKGQGVGSWKASPDTVLLGGWDRWRVL